MGMMDYLIGKNVGREEAKSSDSSAHNARIAELDMEAHAYRLAATVKTLTKRFTRERQERRGWQQTAEFRKLSLLKHGLTEEQIYAEQDEFYALSQESEIRKKIAEKIDAESAEIDASMGIN